jgi:BirA family biotin operon repressor/biotin-[acetyl-CoA-carboxylase] ligase
MELLSILKDNEFVSGQAIAGNLGVTRAAIHKQVSRLRRQGYTVMAEKNRGYMLTGRPDTVAPEELHRYLPSGHRWGKNIHYCVSTGSTQVLAKDLANNNDPDGTLVIAESQTGGYGRLQRKWSSPAGGLWFSLLLRPPLRPDAVPPLTLVCSLILAQTIERVCGVDPQIKWPNDLVVPGKGTAPAGKLAGILTEMSAEIDRTSWVVIGIGLNVNNPLPEPSAPHAVSLISLLKAPVERARLLAAFLVDLETGYRQFCREGFAPFVDAYNRRSYLRGKTIDLDMFGSVAHGSAGLVDSAGFLRLKKTDGSVEKIIAGTVTKIYD